MNTIMEVGDKVCVKLIGGSFRLGEVLEVREDEYMLKCFDKYGGTWISFTEKNRVFKIKKLKNEPIN